MAPKTDEAPKTSVKTYGAKIWDKTNSMGRELTPYMADMAACVRFFSRMPLEPVNALDNPATPPNFERIMRAAPLAGAFVALPAAGIGLLLSFTQLPDLVIAAIVAAVATIVTGALHEDGLSDVADGFFGGHTPQKRLDIMKDSRIGAFGATALILALLLRVALISGLLEQFTAADAMLAYLSAEAFSRFLIVWQWQKLPLARADGLAARFGKPNQATRNQALLATTILLLLSALALPLVAVLLGILGATLIASGCGKIAMKKIGGTTGDVLGALQQLCTLGFMLALLMLP